ncbi:MAG: membrane protein insertion efficiency factor YidD [Synergistaceae bacterium]|jgi:putative membrane protein insertion efficiency factor|nr:membrane protein insertion efficiency factor YidD [Synergistaceae bacterium]
MKRKTKTRSPGVGAALAIGLIRAYQTCISPLLGARCRFYPSCSQYAVGAMTEWGFFRGVWLTTKRLLKCGPWHEGGYDPPPRRRASG